MVLGNKMVNDSTYIIAEIGNNHNGSVEKAIELIDMSAAAGVDAVKFQTFRGLDIVSPKVRADEYPGWNVTEFEFWYQFLDAIALPLDEHQRVVDHAHSRGVDFITTPVSPVVLELLKNVNGIDAYKLASMDLDNLALIKAVAGSGKPVILSTGMGKLEEVEQAVNLLGTQEISVLHCVSDYPLDPNNAALNNLSVLSHRFPSVRIGFSDHSLGHELVIAAVAMGARVIEKHVTLDRNDLNLAEHHFSLEPKELEEMVHWVRILDNNYKNTGWVRSPNEAECRDRYRRSFHYRQDFTEGHLVSEDDLVFIRPGDGIGYDTLKGVLGKVLRTDKVAFEPCIISDFQDRA